MDSGIYCIRQISGDIVYVGQSTRLKRRLSAHKSALSLGGHSNRFLRNAFRKHGAQAFEFVVLETVEKDKLTVREQAWVDQLRALHFRVCNVGYSVATPTRGYKHTQCALEKIASAGRGRRLSEESRSKIRASLLGHCVSEETREKISKANTGKKLSEEAKHNIRMGVINRPPEIKAKTIARIKEVHTGKTVTSDTRSKLSAAASKQHAKNRKYPELWDRIRDQVIAEYGSLNARTLTIISKRYRRSVKKLYV